MGSAWLTGEVLAVKIEHKYLPRISLTKISSKTFIGISLNKGIVSVLLIYTASLFTLLHCSAKRSGATGRIGI